METVGKVLDDTKSGWKKIDKRKRIVLVALVSIVLLAALSVSFLNKKVDYATLFTNLELEDAGTIADDLKTKKIDYKLENGGRDILIDAKHVDSYRLQLAMEGNMPEKSTGFEIFDNMGMMVTDEDRKIMYQRALTGELQRSIMSLDEIKAAKVHLVMSEKSIFETEAKEASASVFIDLEPTKKVTQDMIRGIAALISGAVDNLPEENIRIVDAKGNLLSGFLAESDGMNPVGALNSYQEMTESFEKKMEASIYDILGAALGPDKVKVSVFADLDFDAEETTTISYSDPVIRSEQITGGYEDVFSPGGSGNVADNDSNVIGSEEDLGRIYERITNNELGSETVTSIKAPGKVNRMTTSVVYDGNLSIAKSEQVLSIVAAATGYDVDRGDFISIEDMEFDRTFEEGIQDELDKIGQEEEPKASFFERNKTMLIIVGAIILLALVVTIIISRIMAKRREEELSVEEQFPLYAPVDNIQMEEEEEEVIEKLEVKKDPKETKAKDYAAENPDVAADMIRAWMKD